MIGFQSLRSHPKRVYLARLAANYDGYDDGEIPSKGLEVDNESVLTSIFLVVSFSYYLGERSFSSEVPFDRRPRRIMVTPFGK